MHAPPAQLTATPLYMPQLYASAHPCLHGSQLCARRGIIHLYLGTMCNIHFWDIYTNTLSPCKILFTETLSFQHVSIIQQHFVCIYLAPCICILTSYHICFSLIILIQFKLYMHICARLYHHLVDLIQYYVIYMQFCTDDPIPSLLGLYKTLYVPRDCNIIILCYVINKICLITSKSFQYSTHY